MINLSNKKILLTGSGGFLGSFVLEKLLDRGVSDKNMVLPRSNNYDLRDRKICDKLVKRVDVVIHLAGTVGGIGFNREHPAEAFYDNAIMALNLIDAAYRAGVKKFIGVGSVCSYPETVTVPFREKDLWLGYPEKINAPYGLAKKMMLVQSQAYNQQYNFNAIHLLMINLYGPRDHFDPQKSHVVPALIKKISEAKLNNLNKVELWGTGLSTRELLYVEDAAVGILLAAEKYDKPAPINLGSGCEISIKNLANRIGKIVGYKGQIVWDNKKSSGRPRRKLDTTRAKKEFGFRSSTNLDAGLRKTIKWYLSQNEI